jgi:hypothetical protein
MRLAHLAAGATPAVILVLVFGAAWPVRVSADPVAINGDYSVNGTYSAVSDGQWARTNESFHPEATITNTWTITSICSTPYVCSGQVTSDQGWNAATHTTNGLWYVSRDLPNWEPCQDGSTAAGHQVYRFYFHDATTLIGENMTIGPSGACGRNRPLVIEMPFKLTKQH